MAGMSVCLDTGTTTLEVARCLAGISGLKVVTTSLSIASVLYAHENIELILLGGNVRKSGPDLSGPLTEDNLKRFSVNMAILGSDAVGKDATYTTHEEVARLSQAMVESAGETILVVDSSKFQKTAFVKCLDLSVLDRVVTDSRCPAEVREWLEAKVGRVVYAEVETEK
jgi:DeoR/GlpR family transcriptional regulator of sugar metabolism